MLDSPYLWQYLIAITLVVLASYIFFSIPLTYLFSSMLGKPAKPTKKPPPESLEEKAKKGPKEREENAKKGACENAVVEAVVAGEKIENNVEEKVAAESAKEFAEKKPEEDIEEELVETEMKVTEEEEDKGADDKIETDSTLIYFDEGAQRWRDRQTGRFAKAPTSEKTWDANVQRWRDLQGKFTTAPGDQSSTPTKSKASTSDHVPTPEKVAHEQAQETPSFVFTKDGKIDKRCKAFRDEYVLLKNNGDVDRRCKAFKDSYVKVEEDGSIDKSCQAYQDALKRGDAHDFEK